MISKALAAVGLAASLALAPATSSTAASAASEPPTMKLLIEAVTANGTGCPAGTLAISVSPDNTAMTLTYSDYVAQVGVGARPVDVRKNCQVNLVLHHPREYTYAVIETRPEGFASLRAGAYAVMRSNYYFQGSPRTAMVSHRIDGPVEGPWSFDDELDLTTLDYEPCGDQRNLNINTELRVYAGTSDTRTTTSFISMDDLITSGTVYRLAWKRCPTS